MWNGSHLSSVDLHVKLMCCRYEQDCSKSRMVLNEVRILLGLSKSLLFPIEVMILSVSDVVIKFGRINSSKN
jgi:hypothetical protein